MTVTMFMCVQLSVLWGMVKLDQSNCAPGKIFEFFVDVKRLACTRECSTAPHSKLQDVSSVHKSMLFQHYTHHMLGKKKTLSNFHFNSKFTYHWTNQVQHLVGIMSEQQLIGRLQPYARTLPSRYLGMQSCYTNPVTERSRT